MAVLKLEIGGDTQSTVGTEPSHMHNRNDLSCVHGYEGWLAREARKRNPDIRIWSLSWGIPGWIGNGTFFSQDNIDYQITWLECLRDYYDVEPNLIGLWNERNQGSVDYVLQLRQSLDQRGFQNVGITIEATWQQLIDNVRSNSTFRSSVTAATKHYPCNTTCDVALESGVKFWAGEDSPTPYQNWTAASCWGRKLNQHFLRMEATSVISWAVVWSVLQGVSSPQKKESDSGDGKHGFFGNAFVTASEPWSGHYHVSPIVWIMAHWGQWVQPGWHYLRGNGSGFLGAGGSYVTLVPPTPLITSLSDFTMIVETLDGKCEMPCNVRPIQDTQNLTFHLKGSLTSTAKKIDVWCSNATNVYERQTPIAVQDNGSFSLTMNPDTICTLSTLSKRGVKGSHPTPPPPEPFPNRCSANFSTTPGAQACYVSDVYGSFAIRNHALTQVATGHPTGWAPLNLDPLTLTGNANWTDFQLSVSAFINHTSPDHYIRICGGCNNHGYHRILYECSCCLNLSWTGEWAVGPQNEPSSGFIDDFHDHTWHDLVLRRTHGSLTAWIDRELVVTTPSICPDPGMVGLGCGEYHMCSFRNFSVNATTQGNPRFMETARGDFVNLSVE